MKAVQREDFDGLAQLLIKAGHLVNFLWVGHKAGVQLLIASVNIGDHQHHELHRSSPFYFGSAPLVVWRPPNSTHIQTIFPPWCTRRGGASRRPPRCAPWVRGRATG